MKVCILGCLLTCIVCSPVFCQSQTEQYQAGKIVSIDQHPVEANQGGTDAPLKPGVLDHDVSIQVGETIYACRYHAQSDHELSWLKDRDVQVRVKGKVMYVKGAVGKDAKARIVGTTNTDQR